MKIKYFQDTDTLYIEFRTTEVAETKDLDENTILDVNRDDNTCGITIDHASEPTFPRFLTNRSQPDPTAMRLSRNV